MRRLAILVSVLVALVVAAAGLAVAGEKAEAPSATAAAEAGAAARATATAVPVEKAAEAPSFTEEGKALEDQGINIWAQLVRTVAVLGAICALAYLAVKLLGPRLSPTRHEPGDLIRVVEVKRLDPKTVLYLVEVAGKPLLIGVSENVVRGLTPLELDAEAIRELRSLRDAAAPAPGGFAQLLSGVASPKRRSQ